MADEQKPARARKIVDIAHPGKSAPSPNSKSVIITHRAIIRDPMVSTNLPAETEPTQAVAKSSTGSRAAGTAVIQPLATSDLLHTTPVNSPVPEPVNVDVPQTVVPQNPAPDEVEPAVTSVDTKTSVSPIEPEPAEAPTDTKPEATPESPDIPVGDSIGSDAKSGTKEAQSDAEVAAAEDAEAKRQASVQALIESKKYYLPINTIESRRTKQFIASGALLSLLLAVAWADIAMDAGLIKVGHLHALTHFFK